MHSAEDIQHAAVLLASAVVAVAHDVAEAHSSALHSSLVVLHMAAYVRSAGEEQCCSAAPVRMDVCLCRVLCL